MKTYTTPTVVIDVPDGAQAEMAALGAGLVEFEVTLKMPDGTVVKTETAAARLKEAVLRREV